MEEYGLTNVKKTSLINKKTPQEYIKQKAGRGGMTFNYVEAGYIIDQLNKIFNYMWSFEVKEKQINTGVTQVAVLGKLTGYIVIPTTPPMVQAIVKEQWGGSDIKMFSQGHPKQGTPMDIADDFKAASTDAMKKCASLLGVAQDVYWKGWKESEE